MKIGDLVIRGYAWSQFLPGIIIEEFEQTFEDEHGIPMYNLEGYKDTYFIVMWGDGTFSQEMLEELDYLETHYGETLRGRFS